MNMWKRVFACCSIVFLASTLAGCGGESSDVIEEDVLPVADGLAGRGSPAVVETVYSDQLSLNQRVITDASEDFGTGLIFSNLEPVWVLVTLESEVENLNLSVSYGETTYESNGRTSFEQVVFYAEAVDYDITVTSYRGEGRFQLTVEELNRDFANLTANEYLVEVQARGEEVCNGVTNTSSYRYFTVVNWKEGYLELDETQHDFTQVVGNKVLIEYEAGSLAAEYRIEGTVYLEVNPETGGFVGIDVWTEQFIDDGQVMECQRDEVVIGRVAA
ncbi:MAG: hypothetical protein VXZ05_06195 [Pseudomonadota bacterium]|nr:hypothetical protein [Pseudomonadota bacterium]